VRVSLINPDSKVRPGMSCDADIQTETKQNVVSVPIQSVTARMEKKDEKEKDEPKNGKRRKPEEVVFIVDGSVAKRLKLKPELVMIHTSRLKVD